MKKPVIQSNQWKLRHGSLTMVWRTAVNQTYRDGEYIHPLGIVLVYSDKEFCKIEAVANGTHFTRTRKDNPTNRQISNFCRQLLNDIHQ